MDKIDRGDLWYKSFLDLTEDHAQLKSDLRKILEEHKYINGDGAVLRNEIVDLLNKK